jgi:hypothetical protein
VDEALLAVMATLAATAIWAAIRSLWHRFWEGRRSGKAAYEILSKIELGMQEPYLRQLLGDVPTVVHELTVGLFQEYLPGQEIHLTFESFRRGNHLVTALIDSSDCVYAFAVATTDRKFRPTITTPLGDIRLNKASMASVAEPTRIHYSTGGTGGFGFIVLEGVDGQFNAYRYTDTHWGHIYGGENFNLLDITVNGQSILEQTAYSRSLDPYRRMWPVNVVMLSHALTEDAIYSFALDTEMESYRCK